MLDDDCIRLRALERSDMLALYRWENLSALWRSGCTLAPYSMSNVADYLRDYVADPFHTGQLRLMIESLEGGEPLGYVELYDVEVRHRRANVGILIDPAHLRRHLALRALGLLARYCGMHLGLRQLLAYVPADNLPSQALFTRAGYTFVATLPEWLADGDGWLDAIIYRKILI